MEGPYRDLGSGFAPSPARRAPPQPLAPALRRGRAPRAPPQRPRRRRHEHLRRLDPEIPPLPHAHHNRRRRRHPRNPHGSDLARRHLPPPPSSPRSLRHPTARTLPLSHQERRHRSALTSASSTDRLGFTFAHHSPNAPSNQAQGPRIQPPSHLLSFAPNSRPSLYHGPPARILATLLNNRIIHSCETAAELRRGGVGSWGSRYRCARCRGYGGGKGLWEPYLLPGRATTLARRRGPAEVRRWSDRRRSDRRRSGACGGEEERGLSRIYLGGRRRRASSSRGSSSRAVPERSP